MYVHTPLFYLISLLINAAAAYWVYQDANGRGNSAAIGWAIGTFFCCPIVPIIYLIVGRKGTTTV